MLRGIVWDSLVPHTTRYCSSERAPSYEEVTHGTLGVEELKLPSIPPHLLHKVQTPS